MSEEGKTREVLDLKRVFIFGAAIVMVSVLAIYFSSPGPLNEITTAILGQQRIDLFPAFLTTNQTLVFSFFQHGGNGSLGYNDLNTVNLTNAQISNATLTNYTCTGSVCNFTIVLDGDNYTKSSGSIASDTTSSLYYLAADGTWRNVTELSDIGQGNWSLGGSGFNFTLAGGDGYDFGVRDSLAGGSYWINSTGGLYGKINISNDFVTVGLTENNLTVYNSSKRIIFNSSFNDAVRVDNQNLISLYGPGTQNKTVYFFDWANQSWKVWTRAAANSTHGMPDWLDPRNKQAFKWRYALNRSGEVKTNLTYIVTANDPFVRVFVDLKGGGNFEDDFSSSAAWTEYGTATNIGSGYINVVNPNSGDRHGHYHDLGSRVSDTSWTLKFDCIVISATSQGIFPSVALTSSSSSTGNDQIFVTCGGNGNPGDHFIRLNWMDGGSLTQGSIWQSGSQNTSYYMTLSRTGATAADLKIYSDAGRTSLLTTLSSSSIPSTIQNLQFINFYHATHADYTGEVRADNFNFVDGINNITIPISLPENRTSVTTAESGLVGYWNFNEGQGINATDSSGSGNIGSLTNGPSWVSNSSCRYGNCLSFDGTNDYVTINSTPKLHFAGSNKATLTAWVYPYGSPANRGIIGDYGASGGDNGVLLWVSAAGNLAGTVTATGITSSAAIPANQWSFVALTYDSSSDMSIYLNGDRVGTGSSVAMSDGGNFNIGVYSTPPTAGTYFNGTIDEPRAYSRVLSASELRQLYLTGVNQQKPGIYFTKNNATDNEEVLFAATNWKNVNHSASGPTPSFNITSNHTDWFKFDYVFNSTQNQNFMFALGTVGRMNTTTFNPASNQTQFSNETIESVANSTLTWYDINNKPEFENDFSNFTSQADADALWVSNDTSKSRVSLTSDALQVDVVRDGTQDGMALNLSSVLGTSVDDSDWVMRFKWNLTAVGDPAGNVPFFLMLSTQDHNGSAYTGAHDQLGLYANRNNAESIRQIILHHGDDKTSDLATHNVIFSHQLQTEVLYVEMKRVGRETFSVELFSDPQYSASLERKSTTVSGGIRGLKYIKYQNDEAGVVGGGAVYVEFDIDDIRFWNGVSTAPNVTNITNGAQHAIRPFFNYDGGAAGIWRFDEGSGLNASDSSGGGNTGDINGPTWISNSSCKYGSCLNFNSGASTDKVQLSSPIITGTGDFTLTAWIYQKGAGGGSGYIQGNYGLGNANGAIFHTYDNGGFRRLSFYKSGYVLGASTINLNQWYHVAATRRSGLVTLYVNGVMDGLGVLSGSITGSRNWAIGNGPDYSTEYFVGTIDEPRAYGRAFTDAEIREHYQREVTRYYDDFGTATSGKTYRYFGVEDSNTTLQPVTPRDAVLHLRFNDNSTTNVTDSSGRGDGGRTVNGPLWMTNGSCRFGGCISVDGSDDYVDTRDNIFGNVNVTTVSFWVYPRALTGTGEDRVVSNDYTIFGYNNAGQASVVIQTSSDGASRAKTTSAIVQTGRWHHLTYVFNGLGSTDAEKIKIYFNGSEQAMTIDNSPFPVYIFDDGATVGIGSDDSAVVNSAYARANAIVDEVLIMNRTLNADEVYQLYLGGANRTIDGKWHRISSAEGLQSVAFNLTDHDSFDQLDYDQRLLLVGLVGPDVSAPSITVQSPTNTSYSTASIWANVTLNETGSACLRSVNGGANVSMTNSSGNWNDLMSLTRGSYNIAFYCNDTAGNTNSATAFFTANINSLLISGRSLYTITGQPVASGTVKGALDTGETNATSFTNGDWQLGINVSSGYASAKSGLGIFVNDSAGKSGYYKIIVGTGSTLAPTTACTTDRWRLTGTIVDPSVGSLSSSGTVKVDVEGTTFTNSTPFSNGAWDVFISPCLLPGRTYNFQIALTTSDGKTGLITLKHVAK